MKVDTIVVGQGLAGTNLAFHLLEAGKSILIVDKFRKVTSSKVAAGIMNPVTGRRFAKTWLAEKLFPYAEKYYSQKEKELEIKFFHKMPVYRYFGNVEDQNTWMGRSVDEEIKPYVGDFDDSEAEGIRNEFGGANITEGGWLDTNVFLDMARFNFIEMGILVDSDFDYSDLVTDEKIHWKNYKANNLIFCEGFRSKDNPYFNWLPFTFAKGEVLDIKIDNLSNRVIHNKNGFILPLRDNIFRAGATFRWNEMDEKSTERSLIELKEKIQKITDQEYTILDQKASIRPTTKDRRPFVGAHPKHKNIFIFNGFGSKGVTLTPFLASNFVSSLLGENELNKEVNISRFPFKGD